MPFPDPSLPWQLKQVPLHFHGSPVPTLEILAAILAAAVVALVLHGPLTPHREALEGLT